MNRYFCGCPHFRREGTIAMNRPFETAWEMSQYLLDGINRRVKKEDTLYILGDIAFNFSDLSFFRQQIKCHCVCIRGNHDLKTPQLIDVFGRYNVHDTFTAKCCGEDIFLSHYPHFYWDDSHNNAFHGFSHVHSMRTETIESIFPEIRAIDCGFDEAKKRLGDYIPYHEQEIYGILSKRKGHDDVNFYIEKHVKYQKDKK